MELAKFWQASYIHKRDLRLARSFHLARIQTGRLLLSAPKHVFINVLYTADFKKHFKDYLIQRLKYLTATYDYASLDLLIKAMKDILNGSAVFRENPEKQFAEVNKIAKQTIYENATENELSEAKNHKVHVKKWRKLLYKLTGKGFLCPKKLLKKRGITTEWYPPVEDFTLVREIKVCNLFTGKFTVRKFDRKKSAAITKNFLSCSGKSIKITTGFMTTSSRRIRSFQLWLSGKNTWN